MKEPFAITVIESSQSPCDVGAAIPILKRKGTKASVG